MTDLIGTVEAAEILGTSPRSVKRFAAEGTLRHQQKMPGITGAYLFARRDVERLAAKRSKTSEAKAS